ncbi:hypothetical protein FHG87_024311 [Trinorchestia longiramus]|nr:hypothetical protein FHG87_024311 [Trinorchestia longiramus]
MSDTTPNSMSVSAPATESSGTGSGTVSVVDSYGASVATDLTVTSDGATPVELLRPHRSHATSVSKHPVPQLLVPQPQPLQTLVSEHPVL